MKYLQPSYRSPEEAQRQVAVAFNAYARDRDYAPETVTSAGKPTRRVTLVNATSAPITISLPPVASAYGVDYFIKKIDSSGNAVTVDANASEEIDGALTLSLAAQYDSTHIVCDGSAWYIL